MGFHFNRIVYQLGNFLDFLLAMNTLDHENVLFSLYVPSLILLYCYYLNALYPKCLSRRVIK